MARMRMPRSWLNEVRRKFLLSSPRNIVVFHSDACSHPNEAEASGLTVETEAYELPSLDLVPSQTTKLEREDIMAATKIQSIFRGHLARKAFRALRSLVKLQALARGAYVRNQSRIAMHCMHALVRLQVRVRARQILSASNDNY